MFLEVTRRRNPGLLDAALRLHSEGAIPPNTYVLDLDAIEANARALAAVAARLGIQLYFMTKQFNRNPQVITAIADAGIERGVAVDIDDARAIRQAGVALGHVGHLVQIPRAHLRQVLGWRPEVWTLFGLENARLLSEAALPLGYRQAVLLRIAAGHSYPGQEGGITLAELPQVARAVAELPGIRLAGVTAFPCLVADGDRAVATPNLEAVIQAARILREELGLPVSQVNTPSLSTCTTLPMLKAAGSTHAEPGHALTGTTPLHAVSDQPEVPAVLYLSEIAHTFGGRAYCYGGGRYPRGHLAHALVGTELRPVPVQSPDPEHIDYYFTLEDQAARVGEPVLMAFRFQAFVSRANLALVAGISAGSPRLAGLYDRGNQPLDLRR
ncbi:MAG: putative alanine racemase [Firmicutes bacterium]|nr:putative alanine racemase [Bacillota bacterium]